MYIGIGELCGHTGECSVTSCLEVRYQRAWLSGGPLEQGVKPPSPVPEEELAAVLGGLQLALDDGVGLRTGLRMVRVLREGSRGRHLCHLGEGRW